MNWEEKYNALAELVDGYRRERDEARREADRFRHGCTVEGDFVCPNEHAVSELTAERNFLRALKKNHEEDFTRVCKERDEARAEVEHAYREGGALYEAKIAEREAFRSGAEAMRAKCEQIARHACSVIGKLEHTYGIMTQGHIETVSRLILEADIPEEP